MQQPIPINGGFFFSPERGAKIVGLPNVSVWRWAKKAVTSYGHPLNVVEHQGRHLIDERDVYVMAQVQRDFPLARGPGPRHRQEQMKQYAARLRNATPA